MVRNWAGLALLMVGLIGCGAEWEGASDLSQAQMFDRWRMTAGVDIYDAKVPRWVVNFHATSGIRGRQTIVSRIQVRDPQRPGNHQTDQIGTKVLLGQEGQLFGVNWRDQGGRFFLLGQYHVEGELKQGADLRLEWLPGTRLRMDWAGLHPMDPDSVIVELVRPIRELPDEPALALPPENLIRPRP